CREGADPRDDRRAAAQGGPEIRGRGRRPCDRRHACPSQAKHRAQGRDGALSAVVRVCARLDWKTSGFMIMDLTALIVFATALLVAAASPGPGIIAIVARVIGRGSRGAAAYSAGFVIGDLVWLTVAILGLSVVAQAFAQVFLVIKYAG